MGKIKIIIGWRERRVSDGRNWQPIVNDVWTPRHGLVAAGVLLWESNKFEVKGNMLRILSRWRELFCEFDLGDGDCVVNFVKFEVKGIMLWILFRGRELCYQFCKIWGEENCVVNFEKPYRSAQRFIQAYFCPQEQISVNRLKLSWLGKIKMKKVRFLFLFCKPPSYILRLMLVTSPSLDINK